MSNTAPVTAHSLDVPGARLHYQVCGSGPLLLMIGAPMDSTGFAAIAAHLADSHTVVTYDPRGISASGREDRGVGSDAVDVGLRLSEHPVPLHGRKPLVVPANGHAHVAASTEEKLVQQSRRHSDVVGRRMHVEPTCRDQHIIYVRGGRRLDLTDADRARR